MFHLKIFIGPVTGIFLLSLVIFSCHKKNVSTLNKKALWIREAFEVLNANRYPRLKAISWWNENWENEDGSYTRLCINSSMQALACYKEGIVTGDYSATGVFSQNKLLPPVHGKYHCAFPGFGGEEDFVTADSIFHFELLAGKPIAWAYFSNNWTNGIHFPSQQVEVIHRAGKIPFIRLMPRTNFEEYSPDTVYTLQKIIDGRFDAELSQWARDAAATGIPLLVEFGTEVNGDWFPWNGRYNGAGNTTGYGDPTLPDGPERFRDAYRHIVLLFRANGARNITWFFHVDAHDTPGESWNAFENYYPGDDVVDWVGFSAYGSLDGEEYFSLREMVDEIYPRLQNMCSKPIALLEFGMTE